MDRLGVRKLPFDSNAPLDEVERLLVRGCDAVSVGETPWPEFPDRPEVSLRLGFAGPRLAVRFAVREARVLAEKTRTNDAVWEDSCVELFIEPLGDGNYFNFEINCIGTCLVGYGRERKGRELLQPSAIELIRRSSSLGSAPFAERPAPPEWTLTAVIPFGELAGIGDLTGRTMRANFYKCGDRLDRPHFVTWSPIAAPRPDFHRPECFGTLVFGA